ncbi:hypothetical protein KCP75_24720 [Salmonella enterica subsp. enterica]|nr:hypothetical protein KCP75_24720 [Salmonella enterica subsp. enterica]
MMRPLFFEFPNRNKLGNHRPVLFWFHLLIAPVMHEGMRERDIWLPEGET